MRIFLVRHGESTQNSGLNAKQRIMDANIPLTEKGILQSREAGKFFADYIKKSVTNWVDTAEWRSPFLRVKQTADAFWEGAGIIRPIQKEDILLAEQSFGMFDSIPEEEWEKLFPHEGGDYRRAREQKCKFYAKPAGGESPFDVAVRMRTFIRDFKDVNGNVYSDDGIVVIFTHGTTMRCFIMQFMGYSVDWYEAEHNPKNASIRLLKTNKFGKMEDKGYIYTGIQY